jgi:molybdopterin/thiamine biosynthesis adenylyltransferase
VDRNLQGSSYDKYDEQIAIYGKEFQKKLNNLNIFIIGTGALES